MNLEFKSLAKGDWLPNSAKNIAFLKQDNWDDYSFKTLFHLTVFDEDGEKHDVGTVKIGAFGQETRFRTEIPNTFERLGEN